MSINLFDTLKIINDTAKCIYNKRRKHMYSDYDEWCEKGGHGATFEDLERFDQEADKAYESCKSIEDNKEEI
jgi:phage/plasmid-associated DNA primase